MIAVMNGLRYVNVLLKRPSSQSHEGLNSISMRYKSSSVDSSRNPKKYVTENVHTTTAKPYDESKKITFSNYRTRRVLALRSIMQWLNDKNSGQNWEKMWAGPQAFHPNKVPLDIRMGPAQNMVPKPHKYGNLELVKVQNFLHLTPPSIKNHCKHLKKYCTPWPEELSADEDCEREFPLDIHTTDYINAGQSQLNNKARVVTLQIRLCNMVLNSHARDKLTKLSKERYNSASDVLTITAERCPFRHQNRQYLNYLLTVLYFESWKTEEWESEGYVSDEDKVYFWKGSNSYTAMLRAIPTQRRNGEITDENFRDEDEVKNYGDAVCNVKLTPCDASDDDRKKTILQYKESVRNLLNLPQI